MPPRDAMFVPDYPEACMRKLLFALLALACLGGTVAVSISPASACDKIDTPS
jgi:hypothetical protein